MSTKTTKWIDTEHATVEILDGDAKGTYNISLWDAHDGYMHLGEILFNGHRTFVRTPLTDIEGYKEHEAAYQSQLQKKIDDERACNRCNVHVTKADYMQMEWYRAGGLKAKVPTYYCTNCARLLRSIGAGEHSEMEDRAARVPSYEPQYKGDM